MATRLRWLLPSITGVLFLLLAGFIAVLNGIAAVPENSTVVRLRLNAAEAASVSVVGDFNEWNAGANPLVNNNGVWETELVLAKGTYLYNFVIDGEKWITDPEQVATVDDNFGGKS
jgi:1,4-alpha-glucan branching enzyme